jgi:hypothetical protein
VSVEVGFLQKAPKFAHSTQISAMDNRPREERIAQARAEIAKRIRRVCKTLPPAEFEKLLDRMALIYWKYDVAPNLPEALESPRVRERGSGSCS